MTPRPQQSVLLLLLVSALVLARPASGAGSGRPPSLAAGLTRNGSKLGVVRTKGVESCVIVAALQHELDAVDGFCTRCPPSNNCTQETKAMLDAQSHSGLTFWWFLLLSFVACVALDTGIRKLAAVQIGEGDNKHRLPVPPYTAAVFGLGTLVVYLTQNFSETLSALDTVASVDTWLTVSPETVLLVLLPPLLFEDAAAINIFVFKEVFRNCLLLATAGVLICTTLTACAFKLVLPMAYDGEISWTLCLMLGCILSATDPVAVIAVLKSLGAPERLSTLIAGESLLNDGSAVVVFLVLKKFLAVCSVAPTFSEIVLMGLQLSIGGPVVGALFFVVLSWALGIGVVRHIHHDRSKPLYTVMSVLTITWCYLTFYVAEHFLHTSGVLAVVVLGVLYSNFAVNLPADFHHVNHCIWHCMAWAATSIIFLVTGMKCAQIIYSTFTEDKNFTVYISGVIIMYVIMFIIRFLMLSMLKPLTSRFGYGISLKESGMLTWGALRGAVSLVMALLIKQDPAVPCHVQSVVMEQVVGIVGLTLMLNAPLAPVVYQSLNIYRENTYRKTMHAHAVEAFQDQIEQSLEEVASSPDHTFRGKCKVSRTAIMAMVPNFRAAFFAGGVLHNVARAPLSRIKFSDDDDSEEHVHESPLFVGTLDLARSVSPTRSSTDRTVQTFDRSDSVELPGAKKLRSGIARLALAKSVVNGMEKASGRGRLKRISYVQSMSDLTRHDSFNGRTTTQTDLDVVEAFDYAVLMNFQTTFDAAHHERHVSPDVMHMLTTAVQKAHDMLDRQMFEPVGPRQIGMQTGGAIKVFWASVTENLIENEKPTLFSRCRYSQTACSRMIYKVEVLQCVSAAVVLSLDQCKSVQDSTVDADDRLIVQLHKLRDTIDHHMEHMLDYRPALLRLVQSVFVSRYMFTHARSICAEYRRHGVLDQVMCDAIAEELDVREANIRDVFSAEGHWQLLMPDLCCRPSPVGLATKADRENPSTAKYDAGANKHLEVEVIVGPGGGDAALRPKVRLQTRRYRLASRGGKAAKPRTAHSSAEPLIGAYAS